MRIRATILAVAGTLVAGLFAAAPAPAATYFYILGAGFGHGIGMSQYGAYGYAQHGYGYARILGHYYVGTSLETLGADREVRVLLQSNRGSASFSGASRANGHRLAPGTRYTVARVGSTRVRLTAGTRTFTVSAPLRATGPAPLRLYGSAAYGVSNGRFRRALEFRPGTFGGINAINALGYDEYVQGVVAGEMPSSWSMEALKAQATVARTYGITTDAGGSGFDQYSDTRSQVYRGVAGETARSNAAVRATTGRVVTYNGEPAVTFYFSTSGGRTENVENSFVGSPPKPWLKSVADPYDGISPKHRWGPYRYTMRAAGARLHGLVKGSFRGIRVLRRGNSPRIVYADILGTRGRTRVTGATIRARFGLFDSWAYFSILAGSRRPRPIPDPAPSPSTQPGGGANTQPGGGTKPGTP